LSFQYDGHELICTGELYKVELPYRSNKTHTIFGGFVTLQV